MIAGAGYRDSVPHLVADPACAERDGAEPVLHCIVLYCTVLYCTVLFVLYCICNVPILQWGVKQHAFDTLVEDEEKDEMREQKGDAEIQLIEQSYVAGAGDLNTKVLGQKI